MSAIEVGVIVNPRSGRARAGVDRAGLAARLAAASHDRIEVAVTKAGGHGVELARAFLARGASRVIAWGGDGTVNEIGGALIGSSAIFGIVPAGSGDGLARGLGLPRDPARALAAAVSAPARAMDVGFFGDRHFLNIAGVGFDAAVGHAFNAAGRTGSRGGLRYVTHGLSALRQYEAASYRLTLPDLARDGTHFLIAFANGPEYGNGVVVAPYADPADGWLDAVVVEHGSAVTQLWRARRLFVGRRKPASGVYRTRVREATIAGDRLICHVDGETFETSGEVRVTLRPGALLVAGIQPRSAR